VNELAKKVKNSEEDRPGPPRSLVREYFESAVVTFIMAFFFMTFVAQAAEVPSASMQNTILVGDHFLINKFIFAPGPPASFLPQREVHRGDVIVFRYPAAHNPEPQVVQYKTYFIKRVIGLPGETVHVRGPEVFVNGKALPEFRVAVADEPRPSNAEFKDLHAPEPRKDEPYTVYYLPRSLSDPEASRGTQPEYCVKQPCKVPEGQFFVMGDNRDDSMDSRYWGYVPRELVVGRAMFVIWSLDKSAPRSDALFPFNFAVDFVKNTRWDRIGTLIR
jgi:signal peptidase I